MIFVLLFLKMNHEKYCKCLSAGFYHTPASPMNKTTVLILCTVGVSLLFGNKIGFGIMSYCGVSVLQLNL